MTTKKEARESGFTLLEVAIGIVILVGGLLGLFMAMISAWRLERAANEKKKAVAFATAIVEEARAIGKSGVEKSPPDGFSIPKSWGTVYELGYCKNTDGDTDEDLWVRYFYADSSVGLYKNQDTGEIFTLYDTLLNGLQPDTDMLAANSKRIAEVTVCDPDGSTGVGEGTGYWLTVRVHWKGALGDSELKIGTFIAQ